eukprot:3079329-Amphidinium_carterae.1
MPRKKKQEPKQKPGLELSCCASLVKFLQARSGRMHASQLGVFLKEHPSYRGLLLGKLSQFCDAHPKQFRFIRDHGSGSLELYPSAAHQNRKSERIYVQVEERDPNKRAAVALSKFVQTRSGKILGSQVLEFFKTHPEHTQCIRGRLR